MGVVLAVMVGVWWSLLLLESFDARQHRLDLERLTGPDWDVRAYLESSFDAASAGSGGEGGVVRGWLPLAPAPYPRALRQARGVGRARALDLSRYFEREGADAPADALHGVGPVTARAAASVVAGLERTFESNIHSGRGLESVKNVTSHSRSGPVPRDPP
ncbi:MAG: hypothetical protein ACJA2W_001334 [Planctomycetota bacterium]|jgi:hypothetical protein